MSTHTDEKVELLYDEDELVGPEISDNFEGVLYDCDSTHHYDSDVDKHERPKFYGSECGITDPNMNIPNVSLSVKDGGKIKLLQWQSFRDHKDFMRTLEDYAIQEGFELRKIKCEKARVTLACKDVKCPFRIHASPSPDQMSFLIKTLKVEHTCEAVRKNSHVTYVWVANKLSRLVRENPDIPIESMRTWLKNEYGVDVNNRKLWRARLQIKGENEVDHGKSFRMIRCYAMMILQTNPGSRAIVKSYMVPQSQSIPTFLRIFICYEDVKQGFLQGCRPFIGVDGCHLKGLFKGVLLTAIAIDANLQFFPLAYAICEAENNDSWSWFLAELKEIIGDNNKGIPWCIMSDRQKGIVNAVPIFSTAHHRFCCFHLRNNFQQTFGDIKLRNKFWEAAETPNKEKFKRIMADIGQLNSDAQTWLKDVGSEHWSLSGFSHVHKVEHLTNNHTESFNGWMYALRFKPPIALLEGLRSKQFQMMWSRKEEAAAREDTNAETSSEG